MCSSAPDTSKSQEAALMTASLSKEQLDWAKQLYAETAPDRASAAARANSVSDAQIAGMNNATRQSNEAEQYRKTVFEPLERSLVADAQNFDTEAERERLAGLSLGDVRQSFGAARDIAERDLTRKGVNPNDGAYGASAIRLGNAEALAGADAMNKSRMGSMSLGRAMKYDAAALGRGLPGTQTQAAQLALSQGNSAVNSANAALQPGLNAQVGLGNAYSSARQGYGQAANIYGNIANAEAGVDNANNSAMAGIGSAVGTVAIVI